MFHRFRKPLAVPIVANKAAIVNPVEPNIIDLSTVDGVISATIVPGEVQGLKHEIYGILRIADPLGVNTPQLHLLQTYVNLELAPDNVAYMFNVQQYSNIDIPIGAVFLGFAIVQSATVGNPLEVEAQFDHV